MEVFEYTFVVKISTRMLTVQILVLSLATLLVPLNLHSANSTLRKDNNSYSENQNVHLDIDLSSTPLLAHFFIFDKITTATSKPFQYLTKIGSDEFMAISPDSSIPTNSSIYSLHRFMYNENGLKEIETTAYIDLAYRNDHTYRILDVKSEAAKQKGALLFYVSYGSRDDSYRFLNVRQFLISFEPEFRILSSSLVFRSPRVPPSANNEMGLHQSGGRLEIVKSKNRHNSHQGLFLTVGDFMNAIKSAVPSERKKLNLLSSVLMIDKANRISLFAKGFRNQQGITWFKDEKGMVNLLASEHGPRGGDELNMISKGLNYGWPSVSFGTAYAPDRLDSKPDLENSSVGFELPLFAWLPSVGAGQIYQIKRNPLKRHWSIDGAGLSGDLLMAGMATESIYRLRIMNKRVIYVSSFNVGVRVRSLFEDDDGNLMIGSDSGIVILKPKLQWDTASSWFKPIT